MEDFVVVSYEADVGRGNMALVAEALDGAHDGDILILPAHHQLARSTAAASSLDALHFTQLIVCRLQPLSDIDVPSPIAHLVGNRCRVG